MYVSSGAFGQCEMYFSARALTSGSASNAPGRGFSRHNFTNYNESRFGSLLVTNDYDIVGGRDEEDDDSFRYRIRLSMLSTSDTRESGLRADLLQVPGIQDVVFDRRAGTFTCYVYAITPTASTSVLQMVQSRLEEKAAWPITGIAVNSDLVGITLATTLRLTAGSTQTDRDTTAAQARQAAEDYIDNLRVGETLVINEIADRIRNASSRILDVGEVHFPARSPPTPKHQVPRPSLPFFSFTSPPNDTINGMVWQPAQPLAVSEVCHPPPPPSAQSVISALQRLLVHPL